MPKKLPYFLILLIAINCYSLLAQDGVIKDTGKSNEEQEIVYFQQKETSKNTPVSIDSLSEKSEVFIEQVTDSVNSLTTTIQAGTKLDSIAEMPESALQNVTDSINNLALVKSGIQSKIDSLNQKVDEVRSKGELPKEKIEELEDKITARIDSLQQKVSDKLHLDKLNKQAGSGEELTDQLNTDALPGFEKLSIPGMSSLNTNQPGTNSLSITDSGINTLTSQVDEQLGKVSDIKNNDWIKTDLSEYKQITQEVSEYGEMIKDLSKMDQGIDAQAAQLSEFQTLNKETKELSAMEKLPESMLADLKRYQDEQALKAQAKEEVVKQATDYFAEYHDKLSEAQSMMTNLKKKYSYVPDSRDLSTAVKATSLKNEPLKKRVKFGLGFQIHQTNPISLDLAPNVLYRFNTLFSAGVSGTYRASLGIENNKTMSPNTSTDAYGGSVIFQHMVWKGFFAHAELEYMSTPVKDPNTNTDLETRRWNEGALLGIGKKMALSKGINGLIIFTYDFLHDENSPNPKAWNVKFGFQLGNFKLKDINF